MTDQTQDPGDRTTLTSVLADLADAGWSGNVSVTEEARIRCPGCRDELDPADLTVDSLRRMEGTSDPDDVVTAPVHPAGTATQRSATSNLARRA